MANTTFSGPVTSNNGFVGDVTGSVTGAVYVSDFVKMTAIDTASLPTPAAANAGQVRLINDNGAGDNEWCLVISTGAAWVTAVGAALS